MKSVPCVRCSGFTGSVFGYLLPETALLGHLQAFPLILQVLVRVGVNLE